MTPDSATALPSRPSPGAAGARLAGLYEQHARMVLGLCRLTLRDPEEAEDATQQVFLSAYRSLLAGTEPQNPGAWLGTIARNESRGRIATRGLRLAELGDRERASVTLEEQAGTRAEFAELREELALLPEKQREAVVLRDLYGLRYDEVGRALGLSRPAVESLLFRGRRRLQRRLRPEIAAGVLVVPLALRESLAYAIPGFGAGGASTAGVLTKLAAVPLIAKLAAAGATVGVAASAGVIAERELREPQRGPVAVRIEPMTTVRPAREIQAEPDGRDHGNAPPPRKDAGERDTADAAIVEEAETEDGEASLSLVGIGESVTDDEDRPDADDANDRDDADDLADGDADDADDPDNADDLDDAEDAQHDADDANDAENPEDADELVDASDFEAADVFEESADSVEADVSPADAE